MFLFSRLSLDNSHLLRALALLVVISMIGPGVFGLAPPQFLVASYTDPAPWITADRPASSIAGPQTDSASSNDVASMDMLDAETPSGSQDGSANVKTDGKTDSKTNDRTSAMRGDGDRDMAATAAPSANSQAVAEDNAATASASRGPNTPASTQTASATLPEQPAVRAKRAATPEVDKNNVAVQASRAVVAPSLPSRQDEPIIVARNFVKQIPAEHLGLPVKQQKASFIAMVLPLILAANDEILQRRDAIGRAIENEDRSAIERWARLYGVAVNDRSLDKIGDDLLRRADVIPVSLALAQGAIESGWGTSRFAQQGNALFGQWAWRQDEGLKPIEASNSNAVVRSFPNLFGSVRAYMHNLNTHAQYARFREKRSLLRGRQRKDHGYQLAVFLDGYAEIGYLYVEKLQTLIRGNDFGQFETARLQ